MAAWDGPGVSDAEVNSQLTKLKSQAEGLPDGSAIASSITEMSEITSFLGAIWQTSGGDREISKLSSILGSLEGNHVSESIQEIKSSASSVTANKEPHKFTII